MYFLITPNENNLVVNINVPVLPEQLDLIYIFIVRTKDVV